PPMCLQVHLVGVWPAMLATNRPPLLGKHTDEVLFRKIAYHYTRPKLPLALSREVRRCRRENGCRPCTKHPVTRTRRREQFQQSQIAQPGVPREIAGRRLMRDDVVEGHHWSRDQVQVLSQAYWHHRLEIPVVAPLAVVQLEIVKLIRDGPDATHWVSKLPV